jgi:short-subunit dehydrogenase
VRLDGCTALITGASAGLGREFARQLSGRASALVLVARRVDRLEELKAELTARDPNLNVHIRATDLSDSADVAALGSWLDEQQLAIDLLINNAGLGDRGAFATSAPERVMDMLAVNITALTVLTRRLLPAMVARTRGAVLNVSSSASFLPMRGFAVYAATKAYVTSFSEALRMELRGTGITVTALCPGPVHTEFDTVAFRAGEPKPQAAPQFTYVSSEEVVRVALDAIARDRAVAIPGLVMKIGMSLVRLTPMPILRFAARFAE